MTSKSGQQAVGPGQVDGVPPGAIAVPESGRADVFAGGSIRRWTRLSPPPTGPSECASDKEGLPRKKFLVFESGSGLGKTEFVTVRAGPSPTFELNRANCCNRPDLRQHCALTHRVVLSDEVPPSLVASNMKQFQAPSSCVDLEHSPWEQRLPGVPQRQLPGRVQQRVVPPLHAGPRAGRAGVARCEQCRRRRADVFGGRWIRRWTRLSPPPTGPSDCASARCGNVSAHRRPWCRRAPVGFLDMPGHRFVSAEKSQASGASWGACMQARCVYRRAVFDAGGDGIVQAVKLGARPLTT